MTHICRLWGIVLLSTPSLWTQIDFSTLNSEQAKCFLRRSGDFLPLDIFQFFESEEDAEPFLSTALYNIHRLRRLEIQSFLLYLESVLARFTRSAPELEHLEISNEIGATGREMGLHNTIFQGRLPKLFSLTLYHICTNLRVSNFPSLTRFIS